MSVLDKPYWILPAFCLDERTNECYWLYQVLKSGKRVCRTVYEDRDGKTADGVCAELLRAHKQ